LLTKYCLSNSIVNDIIYLFNTFHIDLTASLPSNAKSAQKLLDSIHISYILYRKTIIIKYNQLQYILYYRMIYDTIKELLSNIDIFKHCVFDYILKYITNNEGECKKYYGEQYNSDWWSQA